MWGKYSEIKYCILTITKFCFIARNEDAAFDRDLPVALWTSTGIERLKQILNLCHYFEEIEDVLDYQDGQQKEVCCGSSASRAIHDSKLQVDREGVMNPIYFKLQTSRSNHWWNCICNLHNLNWFFALLYDKDIRQLTEWRNACAVAEMAWSW